MCGPVVSTAESNRRLFSSFTAGQNSSPSTTLKTESFYEAASTRPDNTAYVGSCEKHVSRISVSLP